MMQGRLTSMLCHHARGKLIIVALKFETSVSTIEGEIVIYFYILVKLFLPRHMLQLLNIQSLIIRMWHTIIRYGVI